jgi:glycosyltransferase involved in cell wall biosynthesis
MDDVPAGPASPGPRRPSLSVVIPVHNGGRDFEHCLRRLRDALRAEHELIVVDDGSTDDSAALAESFGATVVRTPTALGPASARNTGARTASAPIVFFLDADVAVHPETLGRATARFEADPGLGALFGSYDDAPTAPGVVSQYRNLLHHYVHQQGTFVAGVRPARTFWTGCGAIRRQIFLDFGGFDPQLYRRPAIEDIELGYRLTRAGCRIVLARDVLATHRKRWTLGGVIRTDIFQRGVPWMLLMKRSGITETDLNVRHDQKLCVAVAGMMILAALGAALSRSGWLLSVVPAGMALIVALNADFYRFLARRRGWLFAAAAMPLHYLYYCCCGASVVIAFCLWHGVLRHEQAPASATDASKPRSLPARVRSDPPAPSQPRSAPAQPQARRPLRWMKR